MREEWDKGKEIRGKKRRIYEKKLEKRKSERK